MSDTETDANLNNQQPPQDEAPEAQSGADDRVAALETKLAEMKDQLLRAMAETENVRRRMEREREDTAKYAVSKFAGNLLPVADNLRRAVEAVPAESHDNELVRKVVEGIEATERALLQAFEKAGIVKIEALDQPFDANFHEVMVEIGHPEKTAGTVVQLFETGYLIADRLLRPARVAVAKGSKTGPGERVNTSA